jgi:hypothetical protein
MMDEIAEQNFKKGECKGELWKRLKRKGKADLTQARAKLREEKK